MQEEDKLLLQKFGKILKENRIRKENSLNGFAMNYSLLSPATISRIENAKSDFKFSTFIKLANAMNILPAELLGSFDFKYNDEEWLLHTRNA